MQVTLSAGNYGGAVIDWPEGARHVAVLDASGAYWVYDVALNDDSDDRADFIGMAVKADLPIGCVEIEL